MVLSEAASVGKALIATNACGAAHHLIIEGENGFRVPPNDATSLAHAMLSYTTDPGLAHRHGRRSQELFAEYTPDRTVQRLVQGLTEFESRSVQ
jgi:glycosyltransferase involved in cell wall biosynthesis